MASIAIDVGIEKRALAIPLHITGFLFEAVELVIVTLSDGQHRGRGEAAGVYYLGEGAAEMVRSIDAARPAIEACPTRSELREIMPPGGARNAVDCALWELEAARSRQPVWAVAGLPQPRPLITTFTIGADSPDNMAARGFELASAKSLKLKLTGDLALDRDRITAVRDVRPDAWIGVDANQGYSIASLDRLLDVLTALDVALLEQPLARGLEHDLAGYESPIPIAADESALTLDDIPGLVDRFQVVNIKLDKCGGLTEGLAMAELARSLGLQVMVGNMIGTSLAMAPAFVLGQLCDFVDLDGPTFLAEDREPSVRYEEGRIWCPDTVWGEGHKVAG